MSAWKPKDACSVISFGDYVFDESRPSLRVLAAHKSKAWVAAALVKRLKLFVESVALSHKMPESAQTRAAIGFIERWGQFRFEDVVHFLDQAALGEYGTFVHGNLPELMAMWRKHLEARGRWVIDQRSKRSSEEDWPTEEMLAMYARMKEEAPYRRRAFRIHARYLRIMTLRGYDREMAHDALPEHWIQAALQRIDGIKTSYYEEDR